MEGFENGEESSSYYRRLGSLSTKLRQRTYQRAVAKVREARQHSQESIAQLHLTMDVVGASPLCCFDAFALLSAVALITLFHF